MAYVFQPKISLLRFKSIVNMKAILFGHLLMLCTTSTCKNVKCKNVKILYAMSKKYRFHIHYAFLHFYILHFYTWMWYTA
jgi:hypothetical protein